MIEIFEGLFNNISLTALSSIFPMIFGCLMIIVCKENKIARRIVQIPSLFFESLCPLLTIMVLFFCGFRTADKLYLITVLGFTISFIGYIPTRYDEKYSIIKNILVNFFGLISTIFKWSFCASIIGFPNMLNRAQIIIARTFDVSVYIVVFVISFVIIFGLEMVRYILKEYLD